MKTIKRIFLFAFSALFFANVHNVNAQVTIGSEKAPESFSVLELIGTQGGLRLPQLTAAQQSSLTAELKALTDADKIAATKGLMIFNTTENYPETWNGTEWIAQRPVRMERKYTTESIRIVQNEWKKLFGDFDTSIGGLYTFHVALGIDFVGETSNWANHFHGISFILVVNGTIVDNTGYLVYCGVDPHISFSSTMSGKIPQGATVEIQVKKTGNVTTEAPTIIGGFSSVLCVKQ